MTPDELVVQFWDDHVSCLDRAPAQQFDQEGVVCSCGTILGWPDEVDAPNIAKLAEGDGYDRIDAQSGMTHPDLAETANAHPSWDTVESAPSTEVEPVRMIDPNSVVVPADPIEAALSAIDPTKVYTPVDIELQLVDIERRLEQGQLFQRVWEVRQYRTALAFELSWAKAIRSSGASAADMRKADATVECAEELAAKMEAELMVRAVRETMHNLRSMLSGYQSIARSIGASMSVAGAGRP